MQESTQCNKHVLAPLFMGFCLELSTGEYIDAEEDNEAQKEGAPDEGAVKSSGSLCELLGVVTSIDPNIQILQCR